MLFYVLFALTLVVRLHPARLLTAALLLLSAVPFFPRSNTLPIMTLCHPILLEFLLGMLLFRIYRAMNGSGNRWGWLSLAAGAGVLLAIPWAGSSLYRPLVWGLPAMAIVWGGLQVEGFLASRAPRWLRQIGDDSYSIYLTHTFVLPAVGYALVRSKLGSLPLVIILSLAGSLIVGHIVHRWVEEPIARRFKYRRFGGVPHGSVPSTY